MELEKPIWILFSYLNSAAFRLLELAAVAAKKEKYIVIYMTLHILAYFSRQHNQQHND